MIPEHLHRRLRKGLVTDGDVDMSPQAVVDAGATLVDNLFKDTPSLLAQVKLQYNEAVTWTFRIALTMTCLRALGPVSVDWRSVKRI